MANMIASSMLVLCSLNAKFSTDGLQLVNGENLHVKVHLTSTQKHWVNLHF